MLTSPNSPTRNPELSWSCWDSCSLATIRGNIPNLEIFQHDSWDLFFSPLPPRNPKQWKQTNKKSNSASTFVQRGKNQVIPLSLPWMVQLPWYLHLSALFKMSLAVAKRMSQQITLRMYWLTCYRPLGLLVFLGDASCCLQMCTPALHAHPVPRSIKKGLSSNQLI